MTNNATRTIPGHFYSLDAIRGIAAVIPARYHWQFFFYKDDIYMHGGYPKTALLVPVSVLTRYRFELPLQDKIRNSFFQKRKTLLA